MQSDFTGVVQSILIYPSPVYVEALSICQRWCCRKLKEDGKLFGKYDFLMKIWNVFNSSNLYQI